MTQTLARLNAAIQRNLSIIINRVINDKIIGFITITEVRTTQDYALSTVFFTIYDNKDITINYALKVLEQEKSNIRLELAKSISYAKRIPNLSFKYDNSLAYSKHIEDIIKEIHEKEKK